MINERGEATVQDLIQISYDGWNFVSGDQTEQNPSPMFNAREVGNVSVLSFSKFLKL